MAKVITLGDACIDIYVYGHVKRLNPEAPAALLSFERTEEKFGMVLNVRDNIRALGVEVDSVAPKNKSVKTRYIDIRTGTQLLRLDQDQVAEPLVIENVEGLNQYDVVVVSDYNKGFISDELLSAIDQLVTKPVFVDTKKTDLGQYRNLYFKLNQLEAKQLVSPPERLIVTLGAQGVWYKDKTYPTSSSTVVDVCGAGDMFLSALAVAVANGHTIEDGLVYANRAASIAVQHQGVYVLTEQDVTELNG